MECGICHEPICVAEGGCRNWNRFDHQPSALPSPWWLPYSQRDILKKEFIERFTVMGGGDVLDELTKPDDLWQWIIDNFGRK